LNERKNNNQKKRILILAADPLGVGRLDQSDEVRRITDQIRGMQNFERPYIRLAVSKEHLIDALAESDPNIIHFLGHGYEDGGLFLRNPHTNMKEELSPEDLSAIFKYVAKKLDCVFLNACYTQEQADVIAEHVGCVVGFTGKVKDNVATCIAEGFYIGIKNGLNVEDAINAGKGQAIAKLSLEYPNLKKELEKPKIEPGKKKPSEVFFV